MGAVATDEKQALTEELVEARALIEEGKSEAALDALARARRGARALGDAGALDEIRRLEGVVWRSGPARGRRPGIGTWSLVVLVGWLVACVVLSVLVWVTTPTDGLVLFSRGGGLVLATVFVCTVVASVVWLAGWLAGLILHALWRWVRDVAGRCAGLASGE